MHLQNSYAVFSLSVYYGYTQCLVKIQLLLLKLPQRTLKEFCYRTEINVVNPILDT
jgi:hypothetical protein